MKNRASVLAVCAIPFASFLSAACVGDDPTVASAQQDSGSSDDAPSAPGDAATGSDAATSSDAGGAVSGLVMDQTGLPVTNAKVRFGTGAVITTGAAGTFTSASEPATYDLDVVGNDHEVRSFRGLTTRSPIVHTNGLPFTAPLAYSLSGTALGTPDGGTEYLTLTFAAGLSAIGYPVSALSGSTTAKWTGSSTASGALVAMILDENSTGLIGVRGRPAIIPSISLSSSVDATQSFTYVDAPEAKITGSFVFTGTPTAVFGTLHDPQLPAGGILYAGVDPQMEFTVPTFNYPGATYDVAASASQTNPKESITSILTGLAPNAGPLNFEFLDSPVHIATPADNSTGISLAAPFTWTGGAGASELVVRCGANFTVYLATSDSSATLGDLSSLGITSPTALACTWNVLSYPTLVSADAFAGDLASRAKQSAASYSLAAGNFTSQ